MVKMDKDLGNHDLGGTDAIYKTTRETKNGEKSNQCNHCGYTSSRACTLKQHLIKHSGDKPNKCSLCNFAFSRTDSLKKHLKIHSGEKAIQVCINSSRVSKHTGMMNSTNSNQCDWSRGRKKT